MANNTDIQKDPIFEDLLAVITEQARLLASIANRLQALESFGGGEGGGGGGSAVIEDYQSNHHYARNTLVVDPSTETLYRVLRDYTSITVETDCSNGNMKLVGFESQIVSFNHEPSQSEINAIPNDTIVAIYSSADAPYIPENLE